MVIFAAAVLSQQKCDAWKIELEPFEKLPMYSANNLSFKLQLENGECQVGLCNNFDEMIRTKFLQVTETIIKVFRTQRQCVADMLLCPRVSNRGHISVEL